MPGAPHPLEVLAEFDRRRVRCILIGGVAAILHNAEVATFDVDLMIDPSPDNLARAAEALTGLGARVSGSRNQPVPIQPELLIGLRIVTFSTDAGDLDILLEAAGGFTYGSLIPSATTFTVGDTRVTIVSRHDLIAMKRAVNRPKDRPVIDQLEAMEILEEVDPAAGDHLEPQ